MDTLITASPEFFKGKSTKETKEFFQKAGDFLIDRVGRENTISAVVHMDEKTQDDFYDYIAQKYPDLERGESAGKTGRKHIPTKLFKQAVYLSKQAVRIENLLDEMNPFNSGKKKEELLLLLKKWFPQTENFSTQLKKWQNEGCLRTKEAGKRASQHEVGKID